MASRLFFFLSCFLRLHSAVHSPASEVDTGMSARGFKALVDVMTVEFIMTQNEAVRTSTLVRPLSVYANMGAVVYFLTLIHVITSIAVGLEHEASFAGTTVRSNEINADIGAVSIVLHTLVNVEAGEAVLAHFIAVVTGAGERALGVQAALLASV
jgi:hypothetical protein